MNRVFHPRTGSHASKDATDAYVFLQLVAIGSQVEDLFAAGRSANRISTNGLDYAVDLDPTHRLLRITVATALTDEACRNIYFRIKRLVSRGGPYEGTIFDLSQVVDATVSSDTIRTLALSDPIAPGEGPRVIVASKTALFGLARMFELYRDSSGGKLQTVVQSLDEAYDLLKVTPQEFSVHLFPEDVAA